MLPGSVGRKSPSIPGNWYTSAIATQNSPIFRGAVEIPGRIAGDPGIRLRSISEIEIVDHSEGLRLRNAAGSNEESGREQERSHCHPNASNAVMLGFRHIVSSKTSGGTIYRIASATSGLIFVVGRQSDLSAFRD
jgi:hypothetical protein